MLSEPIPNSIMAKFTIITFTSNAEVAENQTYGNETAENKQVRVHLVEADSLEAGISELQTLAMLDECDDEVLASHHEIEDCLQVLAAFEGHLTDLYPALDYA